MMPFPPSKLDTILLAGHPSIHFAFILMAAFVGLGFIWHDSQGWIMNQVHRMGLFVVVFAGGLLGSSLPDKLAGDVLQQRAQLCAISPKTIIAGLLFGFVGAVLYKRLFRLKLLTSDAFARGTCLMIAIGRLGCYAQHCCFGRPTTAFWGQDFGDGVARIPTQLIESVAMGVAFVGLQILHQRRLLIDRRLFLLFTYYGILRFVVEYWREPLSNPIGPFSYYQWFSLLLAITGLYQLTRRSSEVYGGVLA